MKRIIHTLRNLLRSAVGFIVGRVVPIVIAVIVVGVGGAVFASLNPPSAPTAPSSQSYTLSDICGRLDTGAAGSLASTFQEPPAGVTDTMCTLSDVKSLSPQVDAANCAITDDVLTSKTFWGLCSGSGWSLLTGTGSAGGATAATGQNVCYNAAGSIISCTGTGQDGEYQLGATASPRFTDNTDGTVTDNISGLVWLKNANCYGTQNWTTSLNSANTLASGSCGLTDSSAAGDWRLPNVRELASLVDYQTNPAPTLPTGHPFTGVVSSRYWSSTSYVLSPSLAWYVDFGLGNFSANDKTNGRYVWPVR